METTRIKVKIGDHEFEAEGPKEIVDEQFHAWKELVTATTAKAPAEAPRKEATPHADQRRAQTPGNGDLNKVFSLDEKKDTVSLRAHPGGDNRDGDAALLVLLGYRMSKAQDEVLVTKILESLRVSGLVVDRLDRAIAAHSASGYLMKSGRGKGGKYRLTNTGVDYATGLAAAIADKMA